ncbi:phosphopantetheine-binding protein [Kitasatospora sp. GAS204B]|uniref:phosphopantetheine-binding protein n=1 Tax=unclassified Kitasatospora TaxID=2633591 RepID=UPI0024749D1D|nr:phosphopantetheine-binding protein [Kitasatospora sp. GAS204B]MDH6118957.1 methoxymalonate biosynthesis acyl carrier protein [Kitasatospora sp. GAS204B]
MADDIIAIRSFVAAGVGGAEVADDQDIFAGGYVNSLFAVQLVMWLERQFGIFAQGTDLDLGNFLSVERICAFVAAKRAAADTAAVSSLR